MDFSPEGKLRQKNAGPAIRRRSRFREWTEIFIIALTITVVLRAFFIQSFKAAGTSMEPTLYDGDMVFVSKFVYGLTLPFAAERAFTLSEPKRGDLVLLGYPVDKPVAIVRRIVAVGGDRIEMRNGILILNDKPIPTRELVSPQPPGKTERYRTIGESIEGRTFRVLVRESGSIKNFEQVAVPNGSVFLLADNRDIASDSRYWGVIPSKRITGSVSLIYFGNGSSGWLSRLKRFGTIPK